MSLHKPSNIKDFLNEQRYLGRGIVIGKAKSGQAVIAYFITGRSENSKNRIFVREGEDIKIKLFDNDKVEDTSLILYSPIKFINNNVIVTNGDQTDTIYDFIKNGKTFEEALKTRKFEPDSPNFTPRISGIINFFEKDFNYQMSILKSGDEAGIICNRYTYSYESFSGVGHFLHTYNSDGKPIPTFTGEPKKVEIPDDIEVFTNLIWENLDDEYKISLSVIYINNETKNVDTKIININK